MSDRMKNTLRQRLGVEKLGSTDPLQQLQQVMAWYPNKKFYERVSAKSGKRILTIYPPESSNPVFSHEEWYADDWESPFQKVILDQSFFEQLSELQQKAPVVALLSTLQENAEYCQDVEGMRNCYVVFDALNGQDIYYATRIYRSRSCMDVYWIMDCELLYECVYMFNCYNCRYCFHCSQTSDSAFLFNCRNVQHCFLCSNLRNARYCIRNVQHTQEEYERYLASFDLSDYATVLELRLEWKALINKTTSPPSFLQNCEDCEGNYLRNCKCAHRAFESFNLHDAYNVFQCGDAKDVVGSFMCNDRVERCFQCCATGISAVNVRNCAFVWHSTDMEYCYLCIGCNDCFGCIGLRNKRFHIFNKPYAESEYRKQRAALIGAMTRRGEYGAFFPSALCPFRYQDTIAADFFVEESSDVFSTEYERAKHGIPSESADVRICAISKEKFRIIKQEQEFYYAHKVPFPCIAPHLRQQARRELMDTAFQSKEFQGNSATLPTYFRHQNRWTIVPYEQYLQIVSV